MRPDERLANILWESKLRGGVPFGASRSAVSFSEASPAHLRWLVRARRFPAWGLIYLKQAIFDAGGGPVWYARPEQAAAAHGTPFADWIVRYDTTAGSRSDWTHEQEWRLPLEELTVPGAGLIGVLVSDPRWQPLRYLRVPVQADGTPTQDLAVAVAEREDWWVPALSWPLPRFWIEPVSGELMPLPPLAAQSHS
jgi:hypothetical protein